MKRIISSVVVITIIIPFLLFISSCTSHDPDLPWPFPEPTPQESYLIDSLPGSDNATTELDPVKLTQLVNLIKRGFFEDIHSLIIIKDDTLVLEEYFQGWNRHMLHYLCSVTKSVTSSLVGIAVDKGFINGVDETMLSFFPEYNNIENLDDNKTAITLEHLLTMSGGFMYDEEAVSYLGDDGNWNPENDLIQFWSSDDLMKYVLDLPMKTEPGSEFVYNSSISHLLSGIVSNASGQSMEELAEQNLFNKLGITKWNWGEDSNGYTEGLGGPIGLHLHPVNMAMFGYLFLKNGKLNDEQIISKDWIEKSTQAHIPAYPANGDWGKTDYGYQWWIKTGLAIKDSEQTYDFIMASGLGGQGICVFPEFDMVVVITADNYSHETPSGLRQILPLLSNYIMPAIKPISAKNN